MHSTSGITPETRLVRNSAGYWEIRYTERDSKGRARSRAHSCRTKDRKVAERIERNFRGLAAQSADLPMHLTVHDLCERYLDARFRGTGRSKTQEFALLQIERELGALGLAEVTPRMLADYRARREQNVKTGTVRRELGALRAAVEWARRQGIIPDTFRLNFDMPPDSPPRYHHLSEAEEARMWGLARDLAMDPALPFPQRRIGLFICIALQTAARESAITGLTWDRVNFATGLIDFRDPDKAVSRKRRVPVPISAKLRPVLEDAYARLGTGEDRPDHVLGHPGKIRGPFLRFCTIHGFQGVRVHDLRRTWATLRAMWGASMSDIAAVLGDTVATTEKHYAHFSPDYLRGAVDMDGRK